MIVDQIARKTTSGAIELSARLRCRHGDLDGAPLWFRFPAALAEGLTDRADPWLAAVLPLAMTLDDELHIRGEVSPRLLSGCAQIMAIWHREPPRIPHQSRLVVFKDRIPVAHRVKALRCVCVSSSDGDQSRSSIAADFEAELTAHCASPSFRFQP